MKRTIFREMIASDVGVGSSMSDMGSNEDSYAPGDARIPGFMGIVRRPGLGKKRKMKKAKLKESKFMDHFVDVVSVPEMSDTVTKCVTIINSKNYMNITEDIVNVLTKDYDKSYNDEGHLVIKFNADNEIFREYVSKMRGLFNDRINRNIFMFLEKTELERGTEEEAEHNKTIKKIKKDKPSLKQATSMIAKDHIKGNPKYYTKLKKYVD